VRKLGINQGGYQGETIRVERVLSELLETAQDSGWRVERFLRGPENPELLALRRSSSQELRRFYLSSGIHGDEPGGVLAMRELVRQNRWPADVGLWVCPCLNPTGFARNQRENHAGLDLNRQYHAPTAAESQAHIQWLDRQPAFDVSVCLHEDWEAQGFYLYELNPTGRASHAEGIVERVRHVCPIDRSPVIEGRPAEGGIIRPTADPLSRPEWPEAFYLLQHKTQHCYTLEAPSDYPLATRVAALVAAVEVVLGIP
jgi:hypothetical protein